MTPFAFLSHPIQHDIKTSSRYRTWCTHSHRKYASRNSGNGLKAGKSGAAPITRFDATLYKTKFACEVKNFDIGNFMDRKEARKMDPFAQYAMVAVDEAIKDSNLPLAELNPDRVGVIWGSGIGGLLTFQEEVKTYAKRRRYPTIQSILHSKNDS